MTNILFDIGIVIIIATAFAYAARLLRQPMILGYLVAGFVIGPAMAGLITSTQTIAILSELGIAFLLFIVGLELDMSRIRDSGVKAAVIGTTQVLFTGGLGYIQQHNDSREAAG
jgi:Kef-type K+ transport system membrane component KefB